MPSDFRDIDTMKARIVLVEAASRVLGGYRSELSTYAQSALESIGVEVLLDRPVTRCDADGVILGDERLAARTLIWAAGVCASQAAHWLGAPADAVGRLKVLPDLTVPGRPQIFAIGDTVSVANPDGSPVPGIAPAAKQQGTYVGRSIAASASGACLSTSPFTTPMPVTWRKLANERRWRTSVGSPCAAPWRGGFGGRRIATSWLVSAAAWPSCSIGYGYIGATNVPLG